MKNAEKSYNTNLAAEYYVMSLLCRLGKDAYLSLGKYPTVQPLFG